MKKNYVSSKEAVSISGTTRQNLYYLRKHGILKDVIQVHANCFIYSVEELESYKTREPNAKPISTKLSSEISINKPS